MKIYTKIGDDGTTQLIGGKKVDKHSLRVESYGTIDELNSILGLIISKLEDNSLSEDFVRIQNLLFDMGTDLAVPVSTQLPTQLSNEAIEWIEKIIDKHSEQLPVAMSFVLPGGCEASSLLHVARTVARRAERRITALNQEEPVNPTNIIFINRLSDYFFVIARLVNKQYEIQDTFYEKNTMKKNK